MNLTFRPALALLMGVASATLLTACDYASLSPGQNPQAKEGFTNPNGYTNSEVNADSINYKQTVTKPTGEGSATAIKNGSVDDKLKSAPAGSSAATPQTAAGTLGPADQAQPTGDKGGNGKGSM